MKWAMRSGLLVLFAVLLAGNVKADTLYSYSLTGPGIDVTFDLPEFPTVSNADLMGATGMGIMVTPTDLVINGSSSGDIVEFFNSSYYGGIEDIPPLVTDTPAFNTVGGQLYGSADGIPIDAETDPMMLLGSFTLFPCEDLSCGTVGTIPYALAVSAVSTPESSTLLLFGVGLAGLVLFRKRYAVNQSA